MGRRSMPSAWIERYKGKSGVRHRVRFRLGGRESVPRWGGAFSTQREAKIRCDVIRGELARGHVPNIAAMLSPPAPAPLLRDAARSWQESRVDVRESTRVQHVTALGRVLP